MSNTQIDPTVYIRFQTLLLQLEEYDLKRYLKTVFNTYKKIPDKFRKPLVWTLKLRLISGIAIIFQLVLALLVSRFLPIPVLGSYILLSIGLCYVHFLFLAAAAAVLTPVDWVVKTIIITRAKQKLQKLSNLTIIGIAGSYGKTTMKEMIASVCRTKYTVLKTPENVNTALGIARLIHTELTAETEIFVVEMGEYVPGDIRGICSMVPPDIAVITGINEAHLERMQTLEHTTQSIFELVEFAKPDATLILNADDTRVVNAKKRLGGRKNVSWFTKTSNSNASLRVGDAEYLGENGQRFVISGKGRMYHISTKLLPEYVKGVAMACVIVGERLRIPKKDIEQGISDMKPIPHRLEPILNRQANILVIDDSYNGNPDGVREALAVLSKFKRRKVFITPGLVEMGRRKEEVHREIGRELGKTADLVILVDTSVALYIKQGLSDVHFPDHVVITYPDATTLQKEFSTYLKPGDVVLFQNDWPDNYI